MERYKIIDSYILKLYFMIMDRQEVCCYKSSHWLAFIS